MLETKVLKHNFFNYFETHKKRLMLSILMPVYNRSEVILETLISIKNQSFEDWECIIVDDGSTDDTLKVLREFTLNDNRFKIFERPFNLLKGASSCRNYAFQLSKGNYIQFFDSDDIMHPNHLFEKYESIRKSNSDFVICKLKSFTKQFDYSFFSNNSDAEIQKSKSVFEDFVTGKFSMMMQMPMWKRESIKPYFPIREDLTILEDHEFYARALVNNPKYVKINNVLILYRAGENSLTNSFFNNIDQGIDSYLLAKKRVLSINNNKRIKLSILNEVLALLRISLAQKKKIAARKIFCFIKEEQLVFNKELKLKMGRITFFYFIFKILKRGNTRFSKLLKL